MQELTIKELAKTRFKDIYMELLRGSEMSDGDTVKLLAIAVLLLNHKAPEIKRFSAEKGNHARGSSPSPAVVIGSQTLACRTEYGTKPTQPYSGCLSGAVLSYSLINLADQLMLSGKRHAGVVVRYVPSFLARGSASWCLEKYKSLCSWGSSATL